MKKKEKEENPPFSLSTFLSALIVFGITNRSRCSCWITNYIHNTDQICLNFSVTTKSTHHYNSIPSSSKKIKQPNSLLHRFSKPLILLPTRRRNSHEALFSSSSFFSYFSLWLGCVQWLHNEAFSYTIVSKSFSKLSLQIVIRVWVQVALHSWSESRSCTTILLLRWASWGMACIGQEPKNPPLQLKEGVSTQVLILVTQSLNQPHMLMISNSHSLN